MFGFMIRFLICNVYFCGIIGIVLLLKYICTKVFQPFKRYQLGILLLFLLGVPFLPIPYSTFREWLPVIDQIPVFPPETVSFTGFSKAAGVTADLASDFAVSIDQPFYIWGGYILGSIWMFGMLMVSIKMVRSYLYLRTLRTSAMPIQDGAVHKIFSDCLLESNIRGEVSLFCTSLLYTPVLAGFRKPSIYLPVSVLADISEGDLRFIFLHELTHYKHKDNFINLFINLASILYWFHPLVRYALRQMRCDREIACDVAVLELLDGSHRLEYGSALLRFAEKSVAETMTVSAGLADSGKQVKQRILCIIAYQKPTKSQKCVGNFVFIGALLFFIGISPTLSAYGSEQSHFHWDTAAKNISLVDFSSYFGEETGSFVLYDLERDHWQIYNIQEAEKRISPNSTYKIYDALFALEAGVLTPEDSFMKWDGQEYPFAEWNSDQTLSTAMASSVNWYFQNIDKALGTKKLLHYFRSIAYGNADVTGGKTSYWMESSLKISPVEQVELLVKLQQNDFNFAPENMETVRDAILISETTDSDLYGKTGTGRIDGKDVNGWFIGFIEKEQHTYFFACNVRSDDDATGSYASQIAISILVDQSIL